MKIRARLDRARKPMSPATARKLPTEEPMRMRKLILIVDDSAGTRRALDILFSDKNDILLADSAENAIRILRNASVDLVLSDLRMPKGTEGLDLLRWVKKHSPETRFILMSADMRGSERVVALEIGADSIINKNEGIAGFEQPVGKLLGPETI